jgi:cob(I)alamin adenosyltransferase
MAARAAGVRLVARVLPTVESLRACASAGLEPGDIIAMQGPNSAGLDAALLRHLGATVLVTTQCDAPGGMNEKLQAAQMAGATAIVVLRPAAATVGRDGVEPADTTTPITPCAATPGEVVDWLASLGVTPSRPRAVGAIGSARRLPCGLLQIYTGDGKGKTTAAVGLALRARGAGLGAVFVQFVKGGRESAELAMLRAAGVEVVRPAVARSGLLRGAPSVEDRAAAAAAWTAARAALARGECDLLVLDELHAALRHGLVGLSDVLACVAGRRPGLEVVTTGRGAPEELLDQADLVTEMVARRHPYPGVAARRGVEF